MRTLRLLTLVAVAGLVLASALVGSAHSPTPADGARAWREAAATGAPLVLRVGEQHLTVLVAENVQLLGAPVRDADGRAVDLGDALMLAGSVVGDPRSAVRVAVVGEDVEGLVITSRGAFVLRGDEIAPFVAPPLTKSHDLVPDPPQTPEPVQFWVDRVNHELLPIVHSHTQPFLDAGGRFAENESARTQRTVQNISEGAQKSAGQAVSFVGNGTEPFVDLTLFAAEVLVNLTFDVAEAATDLTDEIVVRVGPESCLRPVPPHVADPRGLAIGWPERTLDVAFAVDQEFVDAHRAKWPAAALAIANALDGLYERELDVRIRVADLHAHGDDVYTAMNLSEALEESIAHYGSAHGALARDDVHLLSGKEFLDAAGQANCIGGAGDDALAYTAGEAVDDGLRLDFGTPELRPVRLFGEQPLLIAAHEIEHILSTHHHYADCGEGARGGGSTANQVCTLMFPEAAFISPAMSPAERLVARGWMDAHEL